MLENDLTNIEMLIMKCIWDTPEELALSQLVAMVNERLRKLEASDYFYLFSTPGS